MIKKIIVRRFLQEPAHCAIAACASVANFYNENIDYDYVKKISSTKVYKNTEEGLNSGEICLLLNYIGFEKVSLVSTNLYIFDYTWKNFGKKKLLGKIKESKSKIHKDYRDVSRSLYKWFKQKDFDNNIIIDYSFGKYIRNFLNRNKPVIFTFNWNMFFKFSKSIDSGKNDDIKGDWEEHVVVIRGYNARGVYVCDSHHECYTYRLKKFREGFYFISWEHLMTIMAFGDVFLPEMYVKPIKK